MIHYEYPLNERVRTLLRLEDLFDRYGAFAAAEDAHAHHAALLTLFELSDVAGRADLKTDLIQELDRQRNALAALAHQPGVDSVILDSVLAALENAQSGLLKLPGKPCQYLRENDWLATIKQRATIPGGMCEFDLPAYHHWRHRPADARMKALADWIRPLIPVRAALGIVLKLLRESGQSESAVAAHGVYQLMLGNRSAHLVRLSLDKSLPCVPEIAANKYMLNVRFLNAEPGMSRGCADLDVAFRIAFCTL